MASIGFSSRRAKIDKANATIVTVIAVASFVIVFSLVSMKVLFSQYAYQNRVTSTQQTAVNNLKSDRTAVSKLVSSYKKFIDTSQNIIGGNPSGQGGQNGNNAKIILDALPSSDDFPALVTSVQGLLSSQNVTINSISSSSGTTTAAAPSGTSSVVAMPFSFSVQGQYSSMQSIVSTLESSIRPMQVQSITLSGSDSDLSMQVNAQSYYQPSAGLSITKETVK